MRKEAVRKLYFRPPLFELKPPYGQLNIELKNYQESAVSQLVSSVSELLAKELDFPKPHRKRKNDDGRKVYRAATMESIAEK